MKFFIIICFTCLGLEGFTQDKHYISLNTSVNPPMTTYYMNGEIMTTTTFPSSLVGFKMDGIPTITRIVKQYDKCGNLRNTTTYSTYQTPFFSCWAPRQTIVSQIDKLAINVECEHKWYNPTKSLSKYLGVKKDDYENNFSLDLKLPKSPLRLQNHSSSLIGQRIFYSEVRRSIFAFNILQEWSSSSLLE